MEEVSNQPRTTNMLPTEEQNEQEATASAPWPISLFRVSKAERKMFFYMFFIFLIIAYIYSVLRDMKDAVVIERLEPASIVFLKSFFVTPVSIFAVVGLQYWFTKSRVTNVLRGMVYIFGGYFIFYAVIVLPFQEKIEFNPYGTIDSFGDGKFAFRGLQPLYALLLVFNFWTSSLFYITAELWGNLVLSLLFMSYSNDVLTFKQSLRFVPIFYIGSNIGLFFSGLTILLFCWVQDNYDYTVNRLIINAIFLLCGLLCAIIIVLHRVLETSVLKKPIFIKDTEVKKKKKKVKIGFVEGIKRMAQSKLLIQICFIVVAYNICTNLVDTVFKSTMKIASVKGNQAAGSFVMKKQAQNQIMIASIVIIILTTPFSQCLQKLGWFVVGAITPTFTATLAFFFLGLALYNTATDGKNHMSLFNSLFIGKTNRSDLECYAGQIAVTTFKVTKYAFFDIAKEAISMRFDKENRPGYKAIYDGICGKLGKSGGGYLVMMLFMVTNSLDIRESAQYIFILLLIMSAIWLYSVKYLSGKYNESVQNNCEIDLDFFKKKSAKTVE